MVTSEIMKIHCSTDSGAQRVNMEGDKLNFLIPLGLNAPLSFSLCCSVECIFLSGYP